MEGYFTLKNLFTAENNFFPRTTVLLGGSSVKILIELYDLKGHSGRFCLKFFAAKP